MVFWRPPFVAAFLLLLLSSASRASDGDSVESTELCPKKKKTLHLVAMAPFQDPNPKLKPGWVGGPAVIPSTRIAIRHINSRCDLLEDYRLELQVQDSGCNIVSKATISTIESIFYDKSVAGIIGPGCSEAAMTVGRLVGRKSISLLHIAPSATSPALANPTKFYNTFRPIVSTLGFIRMLSSFVGFRGYSNVAILFEFERDFHVTVANRFQQEMQQINNISVASFGLSRTSFPLSTIKNNFRVVFVFGGGAISRKLMCLAYHKQMLYPNYQFIFIERRLKHFLANVSFNFDGTKFECSVKEMQQAVLGIILNLIQLTRQDKNTILVNQMDYTQFHAEYVEALEASMTENRVSEVVDTEHESGYYDSVWALALSFNASIPRLQNDFNTSLGDYRYSFPAHTDVIRNELLNVNFEGIRGRVQFSNRTLDGEDVTVLNMYFVQEDDHRAVEARLVGIYDPAHQKERLSIIDLDVFISDIFDLGIISPPIFIEVIVFLILGVTAISTIFFHVLNTMWTGLKSMRAISPALNHIIFSGCYLYLLSILFLSLQLVPQSHDPILFGVSCSGFIWCESIALTLIFATICVKSWRIYRIFSHSSADIIENLTNYWLILYVCVFIFIDVVFNILWNAVDPWFMYTAAQEQLNIRVVCNCKNIVIWLSCFLAQKGVLTLVVLYLSIVTRRIPKKEYKQTKSTNALVYSLVFLYSFTIPLYLILLNNTSVTLVTVSYLALCFKNIAAIVLCTIFIFLPPVLPFLRSK